MSANEKDTETQEIPAQKDPAQPAAKAANIPDKKNASAKKARACLEKRKVPIKSPMLAAKTLKKQF